MPEPNLIVGDEGNNSITGTSGDDLIRGLGGNDTLNGVAGNDTVDGGEGTNTVNGGNGNDVLVNNLGNADGAENNDSLSVDYTGYDAAVANTSYTDRFLRNNYYYNNLLSYSNIEQFNITGTAFNDSLRGNTGNDTIAGGNDSDTINGGEGTDSLESFNASDATIDINIDSNNPINLKYGNTSITNIESVGNLTTGSGNDSFVYNPSSSASGKTVNGGEGNDSLSVDYTGYDAAVANTSYTDRFLRNNYYYNNLLSYSNIEQFNITGTAFNDSLRGNAGNDTIAGGAGNDSLLSYGGKDLIQGGTGNDTIDGGTGEDNINGGLGDDSLLGQTGNDTINGGAGNDFIDSGAGNDSLIGGVGNDTFAGVNSGDIVDGGEGIDFLQTFNASNATIDSKIDSDNLSNLNYDNTLITNIESIGNVTTGSGNDSFIYSSASSTSGGSVNGNLGNDTLNTDYSGYDAAVGNTYYGDRFLRNNNGTNLLNYSNIEQFKITGSNFNDSLQGGSRNDTLAGGAGNDSILGQAGNDTINGGEGNDYIDSGTGNDSVVGGAGNDTFAGVNTGDIIDGGDGIDTIQTLNASDATIEIKINSANLINLDYGNTSVITSIANIESITNITTGSGNDSFIYNQADSVAGKSINANGGNDLLSVDFSSYQGAVGNTYYGDRFSLNNTGTRLLTYSNIEQFNITGSNFNDSLAGGTGNDTIAGGVGNDSLLGQTGNDTIAGGVGNDAIDGGTGNDSVTGGDGNDTFTDNSGNDRMIGEGGDDTFNGVSNNDTVDGGEGNDYIANVDVSAATVNIELESGTDFADINYGNTSITNIESVGNLTTGSGNDSFIYNSADSVAGKTINGNGGNDFLSVDFSAYQGAVGNTYYGDRFSLNNTGTRLLTYSNIEQFNITGSNFNDSLAGGTGNDTIAGGVGNDSLLGQTGNDTIAGGVGNDSIIGSTGDDRLSGGNGNDTLSGGQGNDKFVFGRLDERTDTITDFSVNNDLLVFSTTFDAGLVAGSVSSQMFTIGTAASSNEHRFIYSATSGDLFYDSDGIGANEQIKIAGLGTNLALTNNNFIVEVQEL